MLTAFGLFPKQIKTALEKSKNDVYVFITNLLQLSESEPNHFTLALIDRYGKDVFINDIAKIIHSAQENVEQAYEEYCSKYAPSITLTGAEATALLIQKASIKFVFAYPGTSELALCNSVLKLPGIALISGRGDRESAFMAAGGSLLSPIRAAAILHGARGLTNAAGAIADAYRNEIGTIFFVGLPSIVSASFLPPHGENNLITSIGNFVKFHTEITEFITDVDNVREKQRKINEFITKVTDVITNSQLLPLGPTIIGLPQDAMEQRWIPYEAIKQIVFTIKHKNPPEKEIQQAREMLSKKIHPVILIDDLIFKTDGAKDALRNFAENIQAPVLQTRYLRGPMLFERLSPLQNPYFAGSYDLTNTYHQKLIEKADILITIEDRNCYPRVIGPLPNCKKIAITSNASMTKKNKYLKENDLLLTGNIADILSLITNNLDTRETSKEKLLGYCKELRQKTAINVESDRKYDFMRKKIVELLADAFRKVKNPILVDDSQMFGGLLFEGYDKFPENLRVFGDHGAFIGGGMAYAAGLAISTRNYAKVFCCIGDQSFTNAVQSLVSIAQEKVPVIYIVCNNGKSVSLLKQALSQDIHAFDDGNNRFLQNASNIHYAGLAKELGIASYTVIFDPDSDDAKKKNPEKILRKILDDTISRREPVVVELVLPSDPEAWKGIWSIKGNESLSKK